MTDDKVYNVLFLCTHNSARSIMGEVILNHVGRGRYRAFSAGSMPAAAPNPYALRTLQNLRFPTEGLRSKDWSEFGQTDAPVMDFVFTVCDQAAGEICPVWPGQPITAHWGIEDPSQFKGTDEETLREFSRVANTLKRRIELLISLPFAKLDRLMLQRKVAEIGKQ
jgi:arsenate reductase (thioredoxin)